MLRVVLVGFVVALGGVSSARAQPPTTETPTTDRPTTDRPTTDRPTTDRPTTDRSTTDRPTTDRPTTDRPTTDRPTTDRPTTDRPTTDRPTTETPKRGRDKIELGGQLFVRDTITETTIVGQRQWRNELEIDRARLSVEARPKKWIKGEITVDLARGDADLKDAYVRVEPASRLDLHVGRFKRPMSLIALRSAWKLPSVERGLLATLEVEGQDLPFSGGRGDGVMATYAPKSRIRPELSIGLFQNALGTGATSLDASEHFAQDAYARASIEPIAGLTVASTFAAIGHLRQIGQPDSFSHAPIGSLETYLESGALRLWVEGYVGRSPFLLAGGAARGNFWAGRILSSFRADLGRVPRYFEPFLSASVFDPSTRQPSDRNFEIAGGGTLSFAKSLRLQVELAHRLADGVNSPALEGTALRVQLGMKFWQ